MSGPIAGSLVRSFLLRFGHRLPSPWTAPDAQGILNALSDELMAVGGDQVNVSAYEEALDRIANAGLLDYDTIGTVGPLLESFCEYLVCRAVLPYNPHRPDAAVGLAPQQIAQPMLPYQGSLPSTAPSVAEQPEENTLGTSGAATGLAPESDDWGALRRVIDEYFFERETGGNRLEDSTARNFRGDFQVALSYLVPNHSRLTEESLKAYVRWLEKEAPNPRGGTYTLATVARKKTALSSLLSWAKKRGYWQDVDHQEILKSKKRDKAAQEPHRALSSEDDSRYVDAARKLPLATRAMALLGRQCGLRAVDIGKLAWVEVDFANRRLDYLCKKTKGRIAVPLDDETYTLLQEYRDSCPGERNLFPKGDGRPSSSRDVLELVKTVGTAARLSDEVTTHDLRKTFATIKYYKEKADLLDIQRWLGHEDLNTTREYIDPYAGWHRKEPGAAAA